MISEDQNSNDAVLEIVQVSYVDNNGVNQHREFSTQDAGLFNKGLIIDTKVGTEISVVATAKQGDFVSFDEAVENVLHKQGLYKK